MLDAASHPKPTNLDIWLDKKLSFSLSWTNANRSAEPVDLGSPMHTNLLTIFPSIQVLRKMVSCSVTLSSVLPSIVREKNFILDKISFSFSFSVVDINSMKRVAAVVLSYVVLWSIPLALSNWLSHFTSEIGLFFFMRACTCIFLNLYSRSFLVCSFSAITVLWAVVVCVGACSFDLVIPTALTCMFDLSWSIIVLSL